MITTRLSIVFRVLRSVALLFCLTISPCFGDVSIDVGPHELMPNLAGQTIDLFATGDTSVRGFNLRAQIGDGDGPGLEPIFQHIDFTGGIWDSYLNTTLGGPIPDHETYAQASVAFDELERTTIANGLIARLIINTEGLTEGTFPLLLSDTDIGRDSDFIQVGGGPPIEPTILNGSLIIIPEPTSVATAFIGFALLALHFASRRKQA